MKIIAYKGKIIDRFNNYRWLLSSLIIFYDGFSTLMFNLLLSIIDSSKLHKHRHYKKIKNWMILFCIEVN
jgi:hypothetical protein